MNAGILILRFKKRVILTDVPTYDISEEELLKRLETRNIQKPDGTFNIPKTKLKEWIKIFEPPSAEELE